jgi:hypothetical protein
MLKGTGGDEEAKPFYFNAVKNHLSFLLNSPSPPLQSLKVSKNELKLTMEFQSLHRSMCS